MKPSLLLMTEVQRDINNWPEVFEGNFSPKTKEIYLKRKQSVWAWFEGKQVNSICKEYQVTRSQLYRWIAKCISNHSDGSLLGWRALIPYKNSKKYTVTSTQKNTTGHAGSLAKFFSDHPEIYSELLDSFFSKKSGTEKFKRINVLHQKFIKLCKKSGIDEREYPLNTVTIAKTSFYRLFNQLQEKYYTEYLDTHGDVDAIRTQYFTSPKDFYIQSTRPYERIELDGHKIDLRMNVAIQQVDGSFIEKEIERIWIISCIDKASRAILGYQLAYSREYSSADVLLAIKNSIHPWKPREFSIPLEYALGAGFPSGTLEMLRWAVFDEISLDNAKAHLSKIVVENLTENLNCAFNDGPSGTPEIRGVVERFFGVLEERGMHRLPGTTGSNPSDKRRDKNTKPVVSIDDLEDLLEILMANYNITPHSSLGKLSPMQYLEGYFNNNHHIVRYLPEHLKKSNSISSFSTERTVRGNKEEGKRPYIQYENAIYRSISLSNSFSLIGVKLTLVINITDLRSVKAFLPNGEELGILTAHGKWSLSAHDLKMRKAINQLVSSRELYITQHDDPVDRYIEYLADKSSNSKKAATQYLKATKHPEVIGDTDGSNQWKYTNDEESNKDIVEDAIQKKKQKARRVKIDKTIDF